MKHFPDLFITVPTLLLLSLGILVIYTSDPSLAMQQGFSAILGLLIFWFISSINYDFFKSLLIPSYLITIFLLVIVFLLGTETRGSIRWIPLGPVRLQPSEVAKISLILLLAKFWETRVANWRNIFISMLITLPVAGLIFRQPDLGTTIVVVMIWFWILVGANVSFKKLGMMIVSGLALAPMGWFALRDYQRVRFLSFLSPQNDPLGLGYNVIQSTIAVGSGELFGRGLGRGTQSRLRFLPEYRTDFIFAFIAEELGFIGSMIVLGLYSIIIARIINLLLQISDRFASLVLLGVMGMIVVQIVVNIGMNIGIMPVTGITLPLLSYGGSSIVITLISLGFVCSISRFARKRLD